LSSIPIIDESDAMILDLLFQAGAEVALTVAARRSRAVRRSLIAASLLLVAVILTYALA
jgi:hypothetical protein